jgi:hypothetical protein
VGRARNEAMLEEMVCELYFHILVDLRFGKFALGDFYLIEGSDVMECDVRGCTCVTHGICKEVRGFKFGAERVVELARSSSLFSFTSPRLISSLHSVPIRTPDCSPLSTMPVKSECEVLGNMS